MFFVLSRIHFCLCNITRIMRAIATTWKGIGEGKGVEKIERENMTVVVIFL